MLRRDRLRDGVVQDVRRADEHAQLALRLRARRREPDRRFNAADEGYGVAIYHSHPRSAAEPSQTDINLAEYPEYLYVIVSLRRRARRARVADRRRQGGRGAVEVE